VSTRTNILIRDNEHEVWLYRHMDGDLAEAGADVLMIGAAVLRLPGVGYPEGPHDVANRFFRKLYDADKHHPTRPIYELTSGLHGDIEEFYVLDLGTGLVGHASRGCAMDDVDEWTKEKLATYTVQQFLAVVNKDRAEINRRLEQRKLENPKLYADSSPYPMVTM
jgi:hypothetical protein